MVEGLIPGDCVEVMAAMEAGSVGGIVCDPPYGLEFMGKAWDKLDGGGAQMAKVGLGGRDTPWPAFGTGSFGGANPTCATCGGRARGERKCGCGTPDWRIKGEPIPAAKRTPAQTMQDSHLAWLQQARHVLPPGGTVRAFGGTRTFHRLASAMESAGFRVRSMEGWCQAQGFPKSLNVGRAIDKAARGAPQGGRDPLRAGRGDLADRSSLNQGGATGKSPSGITNDYQPQPLTTPEAQTWGGWGTALAPKWEPILVADAPLADGSFPHQPAPTLIAIHVLRKPLVERTVAANVLARGAGALNIGAGRIGPPFTSAGGNNFDAWRSGEHRSDRPAIHAQATSKQARGRWPANFLLLHAPGCRVEGSVKVKGNRTDTRPDGDAGREDKTEWRFRPTAATRRGFASADGTESVANWICAEGCAVAALDAQAKATPRFFFQAPATKAIVTYLRGLIEPTHLPDAAVVIGSIPEGTAPESLHGVILQGADKALAALPLLKPGGYLLLLAPDAEPTGHTGACAAEDAGYEVRDCIAVLGPKGKGAVHYTPKAPGKERWVHLTCGCGSRAVPKKEKPKKDLPCAACLRPIEAEGHPTQKPEAVMRWLLERAAAEGATSILDPFAGSGTTLAAARDAGVRCIGIEREPKYQTIIEARLKPTKPTKKPTKKPLHKPKLRPFLKWVGGKAEKIDEILGFMPGALPHGTVYYEPFLGGGSMFFALRARGFTGKAVLSDVNAELIALWTEVRDHAEFLIEEVGNWLIFYSNQPKDVQKAAYIALRDSPPSSLSATARTLLLNRTGFNGLYRVNGKGEFNVPWGGVRRKLAGFDPEVIRAASIALQGAELHTGDFRTVLPRVGSCDVVFADPPYTTVGVDLGDVVEPAGVPGFTGYTPGGFGPDDHRMLLDRCAAARDRGALVILANEAHPDTFAAYARAGLIIVRGSERRSVNATGRGRGPVPTLLAVGFPPVRPVEREIR
jgi:DNA adenine methylase